ncbi:MAG: helix-turn-helix transcriptional regulator, partial [Clostridia bacterium]|nr:helix-turn-helix transcriptional regulator [Clostridia bacterium]
MKNIREIVSNNITSLRKQMGLTQVGLAKKLNFSDKAVSRWEKGEVIPDVETIENLAKVFEVPITYMFEEHDEKTNPQAKIAPPEIAVSLLAVCITWCIATILFVYMQVIYEYSFWQIFVWAVPASSLVVMYFNKKWGNNILRLILRSILNWSLMTSIYLQFLNLNLWLIYIVGI